MPPTIVRKLLQRLLVAAPALLAVSASPQGFAAESVQTPLAAAVIVHADAPGPKIDRHIYGQFAEHLGRDIYDGLWVGKDSPIPNTRGLRNDVLAALKELHIPVVRWPGGCFADQYHWREGIGPQSQRPVRLNKSWGGVEETNAFGTHEFLDFAEAIGTDAYIAGNVGSGSPQEMADWVEYIRSDSHSALAELRRQNGRDKPWALPYFAVGNETWGCGGNMRPEYYADLYKRYATFLNPPPGTNLVRIASGSHDEDYNWTEVLMAQAASHMDAISLHYYTIPSGHWTPKGLATHFTEDEWISTFKQALRIDAIITRNSEIMDKHDPKKRIGLYVDEWGTWYDSDPKDDRGILYQQNSLRDAIVAALSLDVFHRHADRVRMANIAQMVNVLQAMILTDKDKMVLTPTYHVFKMYIPFQDATALPTDMVVAPYAHGAVSVPSVDASASRDASGRIHLALVNLDPHRAASVTADIRGAPAHSVKGSVLTAAAMDAHNTFDHPNEIQPAPFKGTARTTDSGGKLVLELPPKSIVVVEID